MKLTIDIENDSDLREVIKRAINRELATIINSIVHEEVKLHISPVIERTKHNVDSLMVTAVKERVLNMSQSDFREIGKQKIGEIITEEFITKLFEKHLQSRGFTVTI